MRTPTTIKSELQILSQKLRPLLDQRQLLSQELRKAESVAFIEANCITKEQIELSSGVGKPFFGNVVEFGNWLRNGKISKPWSEWNGMLHRTSDLMLGRFFEPIAYVDDAK